MTPWQVKIAQARMAVPVFGQRAYRDVWSSVRFYPSMSGINDVGDWFKTELHEMECVERRHTRLTDAEAVAIWATRPEGMK